MEISALLLKSIVSALFVGFVNFANTMPAKQAFRKSISTPGEEWVVNPYLNNDTHNTLAGHDYNSYGTLFCRYPHSIPENAGNIILISQQILTQ